jgi:hypothetical protein
MMMKTILTVSILAMPVVSMGQAPRDAVPTSQEALTNEQLAALFQQQNASISLKALPQTKNTDPAKDYMAKGILEDSDIICFGGTATLLPKQAILATPATFKDRIGIQPGVKIVGWAEFYAANRGWITTMEVDLKQAEGNKAIAPEMRLQITKSKNLVVATCQGGPISVLPSKVAVETPTTPIIKP